jgi:hypothetical protein
MGHGVAALLVLRMSFVLLLVVSVSGKLALSNQSASVVEATMERTATGELVAFLNRQGFSVESTNHWPESPFVSAIAADCRLIALVAAPGGWHRDILGQLASGKDQVLFVYRATVYRDQPVWLTLTDHYWRLLNRYAGRKLPIQPVLGIIASPTCNLREMPWAEFPRTARDRSAYDPHQAANVSLI